MNPVYLIANWETHFETDETRKRDALRWVPVPNRHDGLVFRTVASQRNACELFAAWTLMLQIASKGKKGERGRLVSGGHALTAVDMAVMTGFPKESFERALTFFTQARMNWIVVESPDLSARSAVNCSNGEVSDAPAQSAGATASDAGGPARKKEEKEGIGPAARAAFPDSLNTPEFEKRWDDWLSFRKKMKFKPLLPESEQEQLARLAEYGPAVAIQAIATSIANGWQGLFPEKIKPSGSQSAGPQRKIPPPQVPDRE